MSVVISKEMQERWLCSKNSPFSKYEAWLDILMDANDDGKSFKSLREWAVRWNWKKDTVNRFLKSLDGSLIKLSKKERCATRNATANATVNATQSATANATANKQIKSLLIILNSDSYKDECNGGKQKSATANATQSATVNATANATRNATVNQTFLHSKYEKKMHQQPISNNELFAAIRD